MAMSHYYLQVNMSVIQQKNLLVIIYVRVKSLPFLGVELLKE